MNKTYAALILGSLAVLAIAATPNTLRREIPTTSELSRRAFTNETQEGWRNAIGAGQGSNAVVGSGTNGVFIEESGVEQTNLGISFSRIPQATSLASNDVILFTSDTNNPSTRNITPYHLLSEMTGWANWPTSTAYSSLSGHSASADNATTANSAVDADNLGGSPPGSYALSSQLVPVTTNSDGLTITQKFWSTVGIGGDGSSLSNLAVSIPSLENGVLGGVRRTKILFVGDSLSDIGFSYPSTPIAMLNYLWRIYGTNAIAAQNIDQQGFAAFSNPKLWMMGASANVYAGQNVYITQGATTTYNFLSLSNNVNLCGVWLLKTPVSGDMTLSIAHVHGGSGSSSMTTNLYAATTNAIYVPIVSGVNGWDNRVTCTSVSGSNTVIGAEFVDTNKAGIEGVFYSLAACTLTNQLNPGTNALKTWVQTFNPDVMIYLAQDYPEYDYTDTNTFKSDLARLVDALKTSNTEVYLCGKWANLDHTVENQQFNDSIKDVATANNWNYISLGDQFPNATMAVSQGILAADSVHPTAYGSSVIAQNILSRMAYARAQRGSSGTTITNYFDATNPANAITAQTITARNGNTTPGLAAILLGGNFNNGTNFSASNAKWGSVSGYNYANTAFTILGYEAQNGYENIIIGSGTANTYLRLWSGGSQKWTINPNGNMQAEGAYSFTTTGSGSMSTLTTTANISRPTNSAPTGVTIGTTAPDFWVMETNSGVVTYAPRWIAH